MRLRTSGVVVIAAAVAILATPCVAWAKGPSQATITGPGLAAPLAVRGDGEPGSGGKLAALAEGSGLFAAMFGQTPDPMLPAPPTKDLGPRYTVSYVVPGGTRDATITQHLYPFAVTGPVSYLAPGQTFFDTEKTRGGWYHASPTLLTTLRDLGLPATGVPCTPPSIPPGVSPTAAPLGAQPGDSHRLSAVPVGVGLAALALLTLVGVTRVRSRRASHAAQTASGSPGA
jgi:hypothetical protein